MATGDAIRRYLLIISTVAAVLVASVGSHASDRPPGASPYVWTDVPRVIAIGDVHGHRIKLIALLRGTRLVDETLAWSGGRDHLVLVGDLVDRGPEDREILDLVRRLQDEATAAGGRVHVLLGNHEVMNVTGDLRFASPESFAEFSEDEAAATRNAALAAFRSVAPSRQLGLRAFNEKYPPGYFGRFAAFRPEGEYGSWLLEQPAVVAVNGYLFVHGGLKAEVARLGLAEINRRVREEILAFTRARDVLSPLLDGPPTYGALDRLATELVSPGGPRRPNDEERVAAERMLELFDALPFSPGGPLWYRGTSLENEVFERFEIERTLDALDARGLVVAHTPTGSRRITSRLDGLVFRVDVGMGYCAAPLALVLEGDEAKIFEVATLSLSDPVGDPPQGEKWARGYEQLADRHLERLLSRGRVGERTTLKGDERELQLVEIEFKGVSLRAVFQYTEEPARPEGAERRYQHELAAYWLDRHLDLGLVPVAVERTIDGTTGALWIFPEGAVDLPHLRDYGRWDLLDGLEAEVRRAIVFTALAGATERNEAAAMVLPEQRQILIADHSKGFSAEADIDAVLAPTEEVPIACGPLDPSLELSLRTLDRSSLIAGLGAWLTEREIDAVLARRDRILSVCSH